MDHAVHFSMTTSRSQEFFNRCFKRLTIEKSFENRELESLYQRYIFKNEQSSLQSLLAIMSLLSISLASVHFYHAAASSNSTWLSTPAIYLTIQTLILLVPLLMIHSRRPVVTDAHLRALCWLCLFLCVTFVIVSAPIDIGLRHPSIESWWGRSQVPSQGAWEVVFVTFLIYSLLPIPTVTAMVTGFALSIGHVIASYFTATLFTPLLINQVTWSTHIQLTSRLLLLLELFIICCFLFASHSFARVSLSHLSPISGTRISFTLTVLLPAKGQVLFLLVNNTIYFLLEFFTPPFTCFSSVSFTFSKILGWLVTSGMLH